MVQDQPFVALVGIGYWGKNIFRNLVSLGVLKAVFDEDRTILANIKREYPDVLCASSFEEVLHHPDIRAVAIATPARTHYELARKALLAGKDVFVEKPLSLSVEKGKELVELARKGNRILMVGHILQYHPAVRKLREMLQDGVIGHVQYVYAHRLNTGKMRTEENVLWSFAPHDVSVILSLLGREPVKVWASGNDHLARGIHDSVLVALEFSEGVKGHIFLSWLHPFKEQRMVVIGSEGMMVFDDVAEEKLLLYPHKVKWIEGKEVVVEKAACQVIPVETKEPLREELSCFVECVCQRKRPPTDGEEGLRVLRVLNAAERFLRKEAKDREGKYFVHETSCVDEEVEIGEGTKVWHFSHILRGSRIGKNCVIGQNVMIGPEVTIGDRCKIQNNVSIYKGVTLEDEVFCGPSCVFTNVYNPRAFIERKHEFRPTLVKRGATIGANATIVCGVTLGRYSFVGAGAVVTRDVPDYALVVGVPARQVGWVCKCGTTLKFDNHYARCPYCGSEYKIEANRLVAVKET